MKNRIVISCVVGCCWTIKHVVVFAITDSSYNNNNKRNNLKDSTRRRHFHSFESSHSRSRAHCTTDKKNFKRERETIIMGILEEAHNLKVVGSGDRTIVLAHGFGTDQSVWKHLIPHLVDDYRVVLYDNIGAGTTNPDYFDFDRYATLEGFAYDLLAILEELHVSSCIFVGHSMSAMIGAVASISRPDLFSKIVMLGASPRYAEQ